MNEQIQEIRYQVGEAWKGTYNQFTVYGNAAVVQDATGLSVYRSLKSGNVGHPLTDAQWWFCIIDLSNIKAESDRLQSIDTQVENNEATRIEHEAARLSAEQARVNAENARIYNEQQRENAETARIRAEQDRVTRENQRISQEQGRVGAEQQRVTKEQQRVNQEASRVAAETQRQLNENNRVAAEEARVAQYASDHATAEADHEQAVADHNQMDALIGRADSDHTRAGEDHTRADNDHTTAAADHTQAGSDHTRAGQDHTTATNDHTQAGSDHTRAENDHTASVAATEAANQAAAGANALQQNLENGTVVPKLATNLKNWEDRDELSVDSEWSDIVRTTAGDESINSEAGATLVSIVPENDFFASALKATGFNLLRNAVALSTGYYFLVPKLPWGSYGTANEPNGVLFTDSGHNNLTPTVRFKKLSDGVPTSLSDGNVCAYTDSHGYRFFTTSEAGYIIVSGITLNQTCAHIAWSRRYDEYIAVNAACDAGSTIDLTAIIAACHDFNLLLVASRAGVTVKDRIDFGATAATWKRYVNRVKPTWTTEQVPDSNTYLHTATISDMMPGGVAECGDIELNVNTNIISYTDDSDTATTDWVKYELATPVTGTVTISPAMTVEDWGLEMLVGATGNAVVTTQYAQGYPDAVANMVNGGVQRRVGDLEAQIAALQEIVSNIGAEAEGYVRVAGSSSPALSYKHYSFGEPGGFNPESVFAMFYPCLIGTKLTGNNDQVGKILYVLDKLGAVTDNGVAKWRDIDGNLHAIDGSEGDVMIVNIKKYYRIKGKHTINGQTYDVFLVSPIHFVWQGIESEEVIREGNAPDFCVNHTDSDNVQRMHSVYNPDWNGSYQAPDSIVGKFVYSQDAETGVISEEYDADVTVLGGAGGLHTTNLALYDGEQRAMNQNPDTTKTVPFMNLTAAMAENLQVLLLAEGGTFDTHNANLMGSGLSSNDPATAANDWLEGASGAKNGVRLADKNNALKYYSLGTNAKAWTGKSADFQLALMLNNWRNPWHIMEAQRALCYAVQNGVHELEWFVFEGNKYKWRSVPGFAGPAQGEMTAVVWKMISSKCASNVLDPTDKTTSIEGHRIDFLISTCLFHGMTTQVSPSWWTSGLIFTEDENQNYEAYMERDQSKLIKSENGDKATSENFNFETLYSHVGSFTVGEGYRKNYSNDALMLPDTNANKSGAGLHTYVGAYNWFIGVAAPTGKKSVRGFRRGAVAAYTNLSPLPLVASVAPSSANANLGFGTCVRIVD